MSVQPVAHRTEYKLKHEIKNEKEERGSPAFSHSTSSSSGPSTPSIVDAKSKKGNLTKNVNRSEIEEVGLNWSKTIYLFLFS